MNVYLVADLEGVSGVGRFDSWDASRAGEALARERALRLWAEEVNAAVEGAMEAGASQILVLDNHGSGDSLPLEWLHPAARLVHGTGRPTWLPLLDFSVDALLFVGQHARAGAPGGHLAHTYSRQRLRRVLLNGREIGEFGLAAGMAGAQGVPAVFLSGDRAAVEEARAWVPGMECAETKVGLSLLCCSSRPCEEVRSDIRAGVARGLSRRREIDPLRFEPPLKLVVEYTLRECWRAPARRLLGRGGGGEMSGLRGLQWEGESLAELWDRFMDIASRRGR